MFFVAVVSKPPLENRKIMGYVTKNMSTTRDRDEAAEFSLPEANAIVTHINRNFPLRPYESAEVVQVV